MKSILQYALIPPHLLKITGSENIAVSLSSSAILLKYPVNKIRPRKNFVVSFVYRFLSRTLEYLHTNVLIFEKKINKLCSLQFSQYIRNKNTLYFRDHSSLIIQKKAEISENLHDDNLKTYSYESDI